MVTARTGTSFGQATVMTIRVRPLRNAADATLAGPCITHLTWLPGAGDQDNRYARWP